MNVEPGDTYSNHSSLKGRFRIVSFQGEWREHFYSTSFYIGQLLINF